MQNHWQDLSLQIQHLNQCQHLLHQLHQYQLQSLQLWFMNNKGLLLLQSLRHSQGFRLLYLGQGQYLSLQLQHHLRQHVPLLHRYLSQVQTVILKIEGLFRS